MTGVGGTAQLSRVAVVETGPVPGHHTYPPSHLSGDFSHACYTVSQSILVAGGGYLSIFLMRPLSSREERGQDHSGRAGQSQKGNALCPLPTLLEWPFLMGHHPV